MYKLLKFKDKKLPVRVSYAALKGFHVDTGRSLEKAFISDGGLTPDDLEILLFHSLKQGAKAADEKFEYKREQMEDLMDEVYFDFFAMIPDFFPAAGKEGDDKGNVKKLSRS